MAEEASGGSVLKKWGPLAAIVLIAQVVVAFVLIQRFFPGGPAAETTTPVEAPDRQVTTGGEGAKEGGPLPYYFGSKSLERMTVNPAGTNGKRFVQFTVQLGLSARNLDEDDRPEMTAEEMEKSKAKWEPKLVPYENKIKAIIVGILREKTIDELEGDGLADIETEIMRQVNEQVMGRVYTDSDENKSKMGIAVSEVVFSDIIIQ